MKGLVFTEFLEMVENTFSPKIADEIIEKSRLESDGSYTAIGNYDYHEMLKLVEYLSKATGLPSSQLIQTFGRHLFGQFLIKFPGLFIKTDGTFEFLEKVDNYIHTEVRKLYPDAELPTFIYEQPNPFTLKMTYQSKRPFADLAHGLIEGCIAHFQENINVARENLASDGTAAIFTLVKRKENP